MQDQILDTPNNSKPSLNYADFGSRLVAFLIDTVIYTLIAYAIWGKKVVDTSSGLHISFQNEQLLVPWGYLILSWLFLSTSIGKIIMGLSIVDESGDKLKPVAVLLRALGYVLLPIGGWFILGTAKKQALHDLIGKTYVIKK